MAKVSTVEASGTECDCLGILTKGCRLIFHRIKSADIHGFKN